MSAYYLAVDIGASGGRHMLGWMENGALALEEVHRFKNELIPLGGHLCWDIDRLFGHILEGIRRCDQLGKRPSYLGIDTWAVDFVLLDGEDRVVGDAVGYRDSRTAGMDLEVARLISQSALYERTGIQKQIFNSIYQLAAINRQSAKMLRQAQTLLMIPDYFNFRLTGRKAAEYTNATTTQLVSPDTGDWDRELIRLLGFPQRLFCDIAPPGRVLGPLRKEIQAELGFDLTVMLPATHDTASAVLAVPSNEKAVYLSSGTWSLMGVEREAADCSPRSRKLNYTNEGGYQYRYRYQKNIMGLWMLQFLRKELGDPYSFDELCKQAEKSKSFPSRVDVNDSRFLSPASMVQAIRDCCRNTGQAPPASPGELAAVVYHSLARSYGKTAEELEAVTGRGYPCVHIVGGGSRDAYLNQLTANATGKVVHAGPTEATAIGNLAAQMLGQGELPSLQAARRIIRDTFPIATYHPQKEAAQ